VNSADVASDQRKAVGRCIATTLSRYCDVAEAVYWRQSRNNIAFVFVLKRVVSGMDPGFAGDMQGCSRIGISNVQSPHHCVARWHAPH